MLPLAFNDKYLLSNIEIGPAVLYTLLLIYLIWIYIAKQKYTFEDKPLYIAVAITGIVNASFMLAFQGVHMNLWRLALIFYYISFTGTWLIGIRKGVGLVYTLKKDPKSETICRSLLNASYWISFATIGFTVGLVIFTTDAEYKMEFASSLNGLFSVLVLVFPWILVVLYVIVFFYSFKVITRKEKDTLILFGVLNTIVTMVNTVFICTNLTFLDNMAAGFFLFFLTDFLSVSTLVVVTYVWKFDFYQRLQANQTV